MSFDEGLNDGIKYIAIDTKTLKNATETDKKEILKYFEKYKVKVMDESFETLKAKGMVKDRNSLEGILLRIEKIEKKSNSEIIINGSKFRSGTGADGISCIIRKEWGKWRLKSANMTWVS